MSCPTIVKGGEALPILGAMVGPVSGAAGAVVLKTGGYLLGRSVTHLSVIGMAFHGLLSFSLAGAILMYVVSRLELGAEEFKQGLTVGIASIVLILPIYSCGLPIGFATAGLFVATHLLGTVTTVCTLLFKHHFEESGKYLGITPWNYHTRCYLACKALGHSLHLS